MWTAVAIRLVALYTSGTIIIGFSSGYALALLEPWQPGHGIMLSQLIVTTIAAIGISVVIWFIAPWIATRIVSDYSGKCPKCRFSLQYFRTERCPECGLYLGPDFHAPPAPTATKAQTRATDPAQAG